MSTKYYVTNFYRFTEVADPKKAGDELKSFALEHRLKGLVILAPEGINGTLVASSPETRESVQEWLGSRFGLSRSDFKQASSHRRPFRHLKVKLRPEIVTLETPELKPMGIDSTYLSPKEWNEWLKGSRSFHLVDTRNHYEFDLGAFKGAVNPKIRQFTDFPNVVEENLGIAKEEPVLIYCTGGIRCEKATLELQRRGYKRVYQLHGGILKYLEEFPNDQFTGECFVFDDRVAVTQALEPSERYRLCPHCGNPGDRLISCVRCSREVKICQACSAQVTCSKDCAHHHRLRPGRRLKRSPSGIRP